MRKKSGAGASLQSKSMHPGQYVRLNALAPAKMSVTDAAALIGISRPNVSNFLNGKVGATPEMAARIERAFKIPAQTILDLQAEYDAAQSKEKGAPSNTKSYVPPFLPIKADDIQAWAEGNIPARIRFAVFLRTLVHSTGIGLTKVEFNGNNDAERPGWDGFVEASEGTPWIPQGQSGWEFGTNFNIKSKADDDFAKSVTALGKPERAATTFVFVTPRRWPGKSDWETKAKAKGLWKDVRAFDASDLEQWLEQSLSGQAWFANETLHPAENVRSLDRCWTDWSEASHPPLSEKFFGPAVDAAKRSTLSWLKKAPDRPLIIAADSVEEALAFLSQLFKDNGEAELAAYRDRVMVFDKPGVFPRLAQGVQSFIPVVSSRAVEQELAPFSNSMHCIIVCPRNASNADPSITLEPIPYETFRNALIEMKKDSDEITRLGNISGRSLTVLRRQLSNLPAVKTPEWAANHKTAESLVPFLLVGAWNSDNVTDKEALSLLAERPYPELEKICRQLAQLNDAPMWSIGGFRGVISKIDLLFAISTAVTKDDLKRYFSLARIVLGEDDPRLDLPESERWAASIHGKVREFSSAFRKGICETLVLLAVYGNKLFKNQIGVDTEIEAAKLIKDLLPAPLTTRKLEVHNHDLPTYAEAAPETFLSIIEEDLKSDNSAALGLLKPVDSGVFGSSPSRTGLLWALENLAWSPATLPRVAIILARLAQIDINDNWVNKPMHSLESIFRSWMPQTAANHDQRVNLMKKLAELYPEVAWEICVAQFGSHSATGDYSHKPQWRNDGYGFGEPFPTWGPIMEFQKVMVEMALNWKGLNVDKLGDLITRLDVLLEKDQARVWSLVKSWADNTATDEEKAILREKIRVSTLSRRAVKRAKKNGNSHALSQAAKNAYAALEPADLLNKHSWLFRDSWVEESYDEIHGDEDVDYKTREERIKNSRANALSEILEKEGFEGIFSLADRGKAAWNIGNILAESLLDSVRLATLLQEALNSVLEQKGDIFSRKNLIAGILRTLSNDRREEVLLNVTKDMKHKERVQIFLLAPFCKNTWNFVDGLDQAAQTQYWSEIHPTWIFDSEHENDEAVDRLLKAGRPRAAFECVRYKPEKLKARVLFQLLSDIAKGGNDKPGHYQLEEYSVKEVFKHIHDSPDISLEEKAGIEFAYIEVLARPWSGKDGPGIPYLERYIELHPEFFVQAVVWAYKRNEGEDPPELRVSEEQISSRAQRGWRLIEGLKQVPGRNDLGELEAARLSKWIKQVRDACAELSRREVCDLSIGKLLSTAPIGSDGVWPCEAVRDVLEEIRSEDIMRGAHTGLYNSTGVQWRGEGGGQERELANKYRKWAEALQFSHPYVSSELLMDMVRTYEHQANREDTEAGIRRRLK